MKQYLHILLTALMMAAVNVSAQQLYWQENGESSTGGELANIPKEDPTNLSTNLSDWYVQAGNIVNQKVSTNRVDASTLNVAKYANSGTGNIFLTSVWNGSAFSQNNIEYNRRIGNPAGSQTLYFSAIFSVFQVRTDDARFPFGLSEIANSDGDPSLVNRTWGSRIVVDKLSGDQQNGTYQVGITKDNTVTVYPDLLADPTKEFSTGDVVVVIMKLTMDGIDNANDQLDLYVGTSVPDAEPTVWDATITDQVDAAINGVFIREKMDGGKAVQDPFIDFGHLRVADSWSALLPQVPVSEVVVSSAVGNTIPNFTTTQLSALVSPADATDKILIWSVENQTGTATITENGLLVAYKEGTVRAIATANDGSGVVGDIQITIEPNTEDGLVYRAEAEYSELTDAVINGQGCANSSGGGFVKYSDANSAKSSHAYIDAPFTKDYTLKVHYFNPNASKISFSTDDIDYTTVLDFAAADFCGAGTAAVQEFTISLVQGINTIYFKNSELVTPEPLIDFIEVYDPTIYAETINVTSAGGTNAVDVGNTLQMQAEVLPANADLSTVTWSVDNTSIATIDPSTGLLSAVAEGVVVVTATSDDLAAVTGTLEVIVGAPIILVSEINITSEIEGGIAINQTSQMTAEVLPLSSDDTSVTWSVTNGTGEATIDPSTGILTGVAVGTVTVMATANDASGVMGILEVTIVELVTQITVSSAVGNEIIVGQTSQMSVDVLPATASDASVTWSVTNGTGQASIDAAGKLIATTIGTVTVVATANDASGVTGTLEITIVETSVLVTQINITSATGTQVASGQTSQMSATVLPTNATDATITWSVTNGTGEATIDASGLLSGVAAGTVTVMASANDASGVTGTLEITIVQSTVLVSQVNVTSAAGTSINISETSQMSAEVLPADATDASVTWSVSNGSGDATISSTGLLTAVAAGTVTVTAAANDNGGVSGSLEITIVDPTVLVTEIIVSSAEGTSIELGVSSQMSAEVLPAEATDGSVTWSVVSGTGAASIDANGLLSTEAVGTITVLATANDASGIVGELAIDITDIVLSISNKAIAAGVALYPNPVVDAFSLESVSKDFESVEVISMTGKVMLTTNETKQPISIAKLPEANYLVKATATDGEMFTFRIIKK